MESKIRVGILGYGNLGRGAALALGQAPDLELTALFTRRDPKKLTAPPQGVPVHRADRLLEFRDRLDVLLLCGGSATDLPVQTPEYARLFNVVDSFDHHAHIPRHFDACHRAASEGGRVALISAGWDPGLFSLQRLLGLAVLPDGQSHTFWGRGVSQGHSDALRRIPGVRDGRQYTIPVEQALNRVRAGERPQLTAREAHLRECFVVPEPGADLERIEREIRSMPDYFAPYDTTVHFISQEELDREHSALPHGGFVLRSGSTGAAGETRQLMEFSLTLGSNPEFTASVLVCCARAAVRMNREGMTGAKTLFDVPPAYLSPLSGAELRQRLL